MNSAKKLDSLTFLRFVAASAVVMFHYGNQTTFYQLLPLIMKIGPLMVTFFFVLSGFVISISYVDKPLRIGRFYLTRVARILPAYVAALVLFTFVVGGSFSGIDFLLPLSMLQAWAPGDALRGNAPGWSVSVELFFYAVAPALIVLAGRNSVSRWKAWIFLSVIAWIIGLSLLTILAQKPFYTGYPSPSHDLVFYFPLSHVTSFVLGFSGGIAYKNGVLKDKYPATVIIAALIIAMVATNGFWHIAAFLDRQYPDYKLPYSAGFFALPFLVIIYLSAIANKQLSKLFGSSAAILLGEASYAIYIFQMPVALAMDKYMPQLANYSPDAKFIIFFAALIALSLTSYKIVEEPFTRFFREKCKTQAPAALGVS